MARGAAGKDWYVFVLSPQRAIFGYSPVMPIFSFPVNADLLSRFTAPQAAKMHAWPAPTLLGLKHPITSARQLIK